MAGTATAKAGSTTTTAYRAAVVHDFGTPLNVEQVPMRPLEPGQVRVKVEATGLCHVELGRVAARIGFEV